VNWISRCSNVNRRVAEQLALVALLAHYSPSGATPCGLPDCSTCAGGRPGGASAFVRPRLKVLLAALRSTLRDGADRRPPSEAAIQLFGSGWGPRSAVRYRRPRWGARQQSPKS